MKEIWLDIIIKLKGEYVKLSRKSAVMPNALYVLALDTVGQLSGSSSDSFPDKSGSPLTWATISSSVINCGISACCHMRLDFVFIVPNIAHRRLSHSKTV